MLPPPEPWPACGRDCRMRRSTERVWLAQVFRRRRAWHGLRFETGGIMRAIEDLAQSLASGQTTSRALVEAALERIADPAGEGARVFIKVHAVQARAVADAADEARAAGVVLGRYAGIPIALKD